MFKKKMMMIDEINMTPANHLKLGTTVVIVKYMYYFSRIVGQIPPPVITQYLLQPPKGLTIKDSRKGLNETSVFARKT